jgi:hypothetical protein
MSHSMKRLGTGGMILLFTMLGGIRMSMAQTDEQGVTRGGSMRKIHIDRFVLPEAGVPEFLSQMKVNREFIRTLPGFLGDSAFLSNDGAGHTTIVTIATWRDEQALAEAKRSVVERYQKMGFNPAAFLARLHVTGDRGVFDPLDGER